MIAEGNEQIEEELGASIEHLELHGTASLEGAAAPDDEGEVVRPQLGVGVGGIGIGVPGGRQYGAALDAGLQALLSQRDPLELLEPVLVGGAVDDGILQDVAINAVVVDGHLGGDAGSSTLVRRLELPGVLALVVDKPGIVVALVEILEDRGEDLGLLVGQMHALGVLRVHVLLGQGPLKPGRVTEDVLVSGKDPLLLPDNEGHDRRGQRAVEVGVLVLVKAR